MPYPYDSHNPSRASFLGGGGFEPPRSATLQNRLQPLKKAFLIYLLIRAAFSLNCHA